MSVQDDSGSAQLEDFMSWALSNGVKRDDCWVKVAASGLDGKRGLVATRDIKRGQVPVAVPQALGITRESIMGTKLGNYLAEFQGWTGDTGLIALHLLWERAQGDESKLKPWLDVFPQTASLDTMPIFWDEADLAMADGSSTRGFSGFLADIREDFSWLNPNVFQRVAELRGITLEDFQWAIGTALSRSFFVDGMLRLCPLVDFANHGEEAKLEAAGGSMGLFGGRALRLEADRDYRAGEEFFISYGPKGAAAFLEENGFVPNIPPGDATCELEFSVDEGDRFYDDKADVLEMADEPATQTFDLTSVGEPDAKMMQFLRLSLLSTTDAFLLEAVFRNDVWGFMEEPISPNNEEAVNNFIIERCSAELSKFVGNAEEDRQIVKGGAEYTPKQVLCAKVRLGERAALEHIREWCTKDNTALDRKEYYQERRLRELNLDKPLDESEIYDADGRMKRGATELDW